MRDMGFDMEVGTPGADPQEWLGEVQATWLSYEHNPFTRSPFFNEAGILLQPNLHATVYLLDRPIATPSQP